MTDLPSSFWHSRFIQQAQWTRSLRLHLYNRTKFSQTARVLEVGCGTGAILTELLMQTHGNIFGLDLSSGHLAIAAKELPGIPLTQGDALALPYPPAAFDITLCHFLLLWVADPHHVIKEMARVTKPGGYVIALAEPDYGGRIDYPADLSILGDWQQASLRRQGANPHLGREMRAAFQQTGLSDVETGVLGGQWSGVPSLDEIGLEWRVLENDLQDQNIDPEVISHLHELDRSAWESSERVLFVPTFYAWGIRQ